MRKFFAILTLLTICSTGFAESITCKIETYLVGQAGVLMPAADNLLLTASIPEGQDRKLESCAKYIVHQEEISLCAFHAEFIGGYDVGIVVESKVQDMLPTVSQVTFGTLKNGKGLAAINSKSEILGDFSMKLLNAGIDSPQSIDEDSTALDEVIGLGLTKGILKVNEPVLFSVGDCHL